MRKAKMKWSLVILTILGMAPADNSIRAQSPDSSLSLKQVIEYGLQGNTDIKKQNFELLKTKFNIEEYRSDALPQINGNLGYNNNPLLAKQLLPGEIFGQPGVLIPVQFGVKNTFNGSVQLTQQVFNFQYKAGLAAATKALELTRANQKYTKEEVIYTIAAAYYQALISGKQIKIVQANLDRVNTGLKIARVQFDNKIIRKIDLDQYKVNQTNLETDLGNAELSFLQQVDVLKIYMGYPLDSTLQVSDSVSEEAVFITGNSVKDNPSLALLQTQEELKNIEIKNIRAGYYPKVSASANYGFNSQFNKLGKGNVNTSPNAALGLNISIPIFDGLRKRRQVQQRELEVKSLQLDQQLTEKQLAMQYNNALKTYSQNKKSYVAQKANLELAENVYNTMNNNYKLGISNLTELNNTEVSLKEAQTKYLTALLRIKLTELDILKANGKMESLVK
jgi:outer membrane protein